MGSMFPVGRCLSSAFTSIGFALARASLLLSSTNTIFTKGSTGSNWGVSVGDSFNYKWSTILTEDHKTEWRWRFLEFTNDHKVVEISYMKPYYNKRKYFNNNL